MDGPLPLSTGVVVRRTSRDDLSAIAVIAEAVELFGGDMLGEMIEPYLGSTAEDLWFSAEDDGRLVGFCFCEPERFTNGTWSLLAIGVAHQQQGRGVGSSLMAQLEVELRAAAGRILIVETTSAADQADARAFYLARGYVQEATLREFWDVGVDKVVFCKHL